MPQLLNQLQEQRAAARREGDEILHRASTEGRDLTPEELTAYQLQVAAEREAADAMEAERDRQLAEVRAMATRGRQPTLSRQSAELASQFRSAIFAKSPSRSTCTPSSWPTIGPRTFPSPSWAGPAGCGSTTGTC